MKKMVIMLVVSLFASSAHAGVGMKSAAGVFLGTAHTIACSTGITCTTDNGGTMTVVAAQTTGTSLALTGTLTGDGGDAFYGFLNNTVTATATTITAAQCGSTFINSGAVTINLPEASTAVGCRLTFITANAANYVVNPDDGDQILVLTNAAGDSIVNATLGNTVTIQAINSSQWAQLSAVGTWTDNN
jgi:hypothetical protein